MKTLFCLVRYQQYLPLYFSGVFITGAGDPCLITTLNIHDAWNFTSKEEAEFGYAMLGFPEELRVEVHAIV